MFYLFRKTFDAFGPDFVRGFRTMQALNKFVTNDIALLEKEYPGEKWRRSDYFVAKRMKQLPRPKKRKPEIKHEDRKYPIDWVLSSKQGG